MDEKKEKLIELNGKKLTLQAFQEEKEKLEKKKGITVVEISEGVFRTRIQG